MEKLAQAGNTYYIFDSMGNGMSFTYLGRVVGSVKYQNVSLSLRNIQDVEVISILGMSGKNKCDVLFDGVAGTVNSSYLELHGKLKGLSNMGLVPFRITRPEEPGLMQLLFVLKPNTITREKLKDFLSIKEWRVL